MIVSLWKSPYWKNDLPSVLFTITVKTCVLAILVNKGSSILSFYQLKLSYLDTPPI